MELNLPHKASDQEIHSTVVEVANSVLSLSLPQFRDF